MMVRLFRTMSCLFNKLLTHGRAKPSLQPFVRVVVVLASMTIPRAWWRKKKDAFR